MDHDDFNPSLISGGDHTTAAQMAEDDAFNPALISGGDHPAVDQPDEGDIVQSPLAFLDADEVTE